MTFTITTNNLPKVEGEYRENYNLSQNSWFGCGGSCAVFFKPKNEDDLQNFLQNYNKSIKIAVIGALSNTVVRDGGFDGVIIKLGREFAGINLENNIIRCGSAVLDYNLAIFAEQNNISGLEFLSGIPGTIGGNVIMNAGCYGGEICDIFSSATGFDLNGNYKIFTKQNAGFAYRSSLIKNCIITSVDVFAKQGNAEEISAKMEQIKTQREQSQPLKQKTCGSTFANPSEDDIIEKQKHPLPPKAWQVVKQIVGENFKIGGAFFSPKHYNFMINDGTATASDIENLGEFVRTKALSELGINLRWEIKFIGEKL